MLGQPGLAMHQLNKFYQERVMVHKVTISQTLHELCKIVQEILKEVESQEPRFISTLHEHNGRYEGLRVISPVEFEIVLYLNQMGVFNFVDDGSVPGSAVLKLSDGRKRSMSLWVEFITASGYLSARKIRSRFQTLVAGAIDRTQFRDCVKILPDNSEVKLRIKDRFTVQITTAFRCAGIWPRSASQWPLPNSSNPHLPNPQMITEVKAEGFDLLSKEPQINQYNSKQQQASMEGDYWVMSFALAEDLLLNLECRRKVFSILKTIKYLYFDPSIPENPISTYLLKTLVLFECEKQAAWDEMNLGNRLIGILLQLISCLQCRKCSHYFLPTLDLLKGRSPDVLDRTAKVVWNLVRDLIINPRCLDQLAY